VRIRDLAKATQYNGRIAVVVAIAPNGSETRLDVQLEDAPESSLLRLKPSNVECFGDGANVVDADGVECPSAEPPTPAPNSSVAPADGGAPEGGDADAPAPHPPVDPALHTSESADTAVDVDGGVDL